MSTLFIVVYMLCMMGLCVYNTPYIAYILALILDEMNVLERHYERRFMESFSTRCFGPMTF